VAVIDSVLALLKNSPQAYQSAQGLQSQTPQSPTLQPQRPVADPTQTQGSSWVSDLIAQHANDGGRIKRTPVGFNFQSIPFDPSSYYRALDTSKTVSQLATNVAETEAQNRQQKALEAQQAADAAAAKNALGGVNPNFTGGGSNSGIYNTTGKSIKYGLKGIAPDVGKAADYFGSKYGIQTIGGRGPGSVPNSDHPKGLALDYMVYNNKAKGTALANDVIKNYKAWNVKYVIWYHYIWHPGRGWSRYSGPSPHTDHVHVSFNS
jgi:hypothetical protein